MAVTSLKPGERFGRYEIAELLGRGGMGEVYRAQDTLLHRRIALKVLHPSAPSAPSDESGPEGAGSTSDGAARILREARAAAGIEHPNAISIYDVGEVEGTPYLAMEFIAGKNLRHLIGDPSLSIARRLRWLIDVARGLAAAHKLGIVHRDIKPENVMVRDDGVVKVLDFGIAHRASAKPDPNAPTEAARIAGTLSAEGVVIGTPFYMPPEQMRGEALDGRTDQFAWGVLAYELLTGDVPWDRNADSVRLVAQILARDVGPLRERNAEIPLAVDAAIRRTLTKAPSGRFRDIGEVADLLEAYAAPAGGATGRGEVRISIPAEELHTTLPPTLATPHGSVVAPLVRETPASAGEPARTSDPEVAKEKNPVRLLLAGAAIAVACLVGGASARRWVPVRTAPAEARTDAAVPVRSESEMSANPQATAAYRAGLQAFRDGAFDAARRQLDHAIELDSTFAAAHLRRAVLPYEEVATTLNHDLQEARSARNTLSEHDRIVLEAMEPWTRVPLDLQDGANRFGAAHRGEPADPDFAFNLGWALYGAYKSEGAERAFDEAITNDPSFAMAWRMKARARVLRNELAGASAAYARCLAVSPGATSCLEDLAQLQSNDGDCKGMATTIRRLIAISPENFRPYEMLAGALVGSDEPLGAVRAALEQGWARLPPRLDFRRSLDEASLATLVGDFQQAESAYVTAESKLGERSGDVQHYGVAFPRMLLALETGDRRKALSIAGEYLRKRSAWRTNDVYADLSITIRALEKRAGGLEREAFEGTRATWLTSEAERIRRVGLLASAYAGTTWSLAYALAADSAGEAKDALAARPPERPLLDSWTDAPFLEEPIGRTELLARDLDEAVPTLARVSASCELIGGLASAHFTTWASADLGDALEARGDTTGACAAFKRVLQRWGDATPPSQTARRARARRRALRCDL